MDIVNLKRIITANIQVAPSARKTLTLTGDALGSATMASVFSTYLGEPLTIELTRPPVETSDSISVIGTSSNTIFSQMSVAARFSVVDSDGALLLTAQPNSGWTFASSFPALSDTLFPALDFKEDSGLYLATYQTDIPLGLSFIGALRLSGMLGYAAWLLGGGSEISISGPIQLISGIPAMTLAVQFSTAPIELGFFRLPWVRFEITSAVEPATDTEPASVTAVASISSSIDFEAQNGTISIPLRADTYLNAPWVRFSTNIGAALDTSLDSLSSLANGLDLGDVVPEQLPIQDQVGLKELSLQVDLAERRLDAVIIGVESKQSWTLIENAISIEKLELDFRLDNPTGAKRLSMMLSGEFGIGKK